MSNENLTPETGVPADMSALPSETGATADKNAMNPETGIPAVKTTLPSTWSAVGTVFKLELLGRVRSKKWIIALVVWIAVLVLTWLGTLAFARQYMWGGEVGSTPQYEVLMWVLGMLLFFATAVSLVVAPALSSTSINGDRETANLAILQVTPITPGQLLWGKLLAAWISGMVFALAAAIPLGIMVTIHGLGWGMLGRSLAIILVEIFVVCALGLGFSAVITRPVISVLITYLVLGALTVGGPMAFAFTYPAILEKVEYPVMILDQNPPAKGVPYGTYTQKYEKESWTEYCYQSTRDNTVSHTDRTWFLLMTSPFTILSDAATGLQTGRKALAAKNDEQRYSVTSSSPFALISAGVANARRPRPSSAQYLQKLKAVPQPYISVWDDCYIDKDNQVHDANEDKQLDAARSNFSDDRLGFLSYMGHCWYWGLGLHVVLAVIAVVVAWRRLRTPVRHLAKGVRIA
ncbi:ABC transporter permease [Mobiluncus mulieris]|uniref:ABC transporter permease n=1 Tax=Mobiluncus mulieris TaxID=2052 RepID=UPI000E007A15|nr:ABC transporter permease subunit [Mobiluncus mulieris]STY85190.1 ABC-type transport system involved in multi-copper enzyme maturation, permease component [Mobiluncus mulieris]